MAKAKFVLTPDLVKVEPEPPQLQPIFVKSMDVEAGRGVVMQVPVENFSYAEPTHPEMSQQEGAGTNTRAHVEENTQEGSGEGRGPEKNVEEPQRSFEPKIQREQFNLRIDTTIKREFHIWCLRHGISMTNALEEALKYHMEKAL